ncbi:hypothetical protein V8E36_004135 [Tilletia maclaganii]
MARPGLAHTASYNAQLDFLLRGAALQVQDRALVSSQRRRKRSNTDRQQGDPDDGTSTEDDDDGEAADQLTNEYGTSTDTETESIDATGGQEAPSLRRRSQSRRHHDDEDEEDDTDENSSVTSDSTAEESSLGFDPALATSVATLGPSSGPAHQRLVPNLSVAPEQPGTTASFSSELSSSNLRLTVPTTGRMSHQLRTPTRSFSANLNPPPEGSAAQDHALDEAATLYALATASSTTSLTRRRAPRRHRTLSSVSVSVQTPTAAPGVGAGQQVVGGDEAVLKGQLRVSPATPRRADSVGPEGGVLDLREFVSYLLSLFPNRSLFPPPPHPFVHHDLRRPAPPKPHATTALLGSVLRESGCVRVWALRAGVMRPECMVTSCVPRGGHKHLGRLRDPGGVGRIRIRIAAPK